MTGSHHKEQSWNRYLNRGRITIWKMIIEKKGKKGNSGGFHQVARITDLHQVMGLETNGLPDKDVPNGFCLVPVFTRTGKKGQQ